MRQKIFFISFISSLFLFNSCIWTEEGYNKSVMNEEYNGVVKHANEDEQGADYRLENGKTFGWRWGEFQSYDKYISLGDTCFKPKGSTVLRVLRTNGDTVLLDLSWAAARHHGSGSFEIHLKDGKVARFTIDGYPLQQ